MEAIHTANQTYEYGQAFYGIPLDTWVQNAHKSSCIAYGWKHFPLKKGAFGYDNLAVSIGYTLSHILTAPHDTIDVVSDLIHQGWCINYIYWRDHQPWLNPTYKYIQPYAPLGDERRNTCAQTVFQDLDQEEKDKDIVLARFILGEVGELCSR